MPTVPPIERRTPRRLFDVPVIIERRDGSIVHGRCFDASDEGFGITAEVKLEVGEIVRLTIGAKTASFFSARVVWQHDSRIGLYCVGWKPLNLAQDK